MLEKKHNAYTKQFMQKILVFIDSILLNATNLTPEEANKTLAAGVLNIRDAIFSDMIKDNHIDEFNQFLQFQENSKKNNMAEAKENQKDLNQETELASDQKA